MRDSYLRVLACHLLARAPDDLTGSHEFDHDLLTSHAEDPVVAVSAERAAVYRYLLLCGFGDVRVLGRVRL